MFLTKGGGSLGPLVSVSTILDIEDSILDTFRYCEKVRDLGFRSIRDTIFSALRDTPPPWQMPLTICLEVIGKVTSTAKLGLIGGTINGPSHWLLDTLWGRDCLLHTQVALVFTQDLKTYGGSCGEKQI